MCVHCKDAPTCDHECDICAASHGEYCAECGHASTGLPARTPGMRPTWRAPRKPPTPTPSLLVSQRKLATPKATKKAKEFNVPRECRSPSLDRREIQSDS